MSKKYVVPKHKWYEFTDYLTRIDEELAVIIKQLNDIISRMGKIIEYITTTPLSTMPIRTTSIPIPVKIKEIREYNVNDDEDTEITVTPPIYMLITPDGGDIWFNKMKTETSQNFKIKDGQVYALYLGEENRFYIRSTGGTVKVYVMLLEPIQ